MGDHFTWEGDLSCIQLIITVTCHLTQAIHFSIIMNYVCAPRASKCRFFQHSGSFQSIQRGCFCTSNHHFMLIVGHICSLLTNCFYYNSITQDGKFKKDSPTYSLACLMNPNQSLCYFGALSLHLPTEGTGYGTGGKYNACMSCKSSTQKLWRGKVIQETHGWISW